MTIQAHSTQTNNLLQQMTQTLVEGIAISDKHGQLIFANRALERLLGYESGELVGRSWTALFPSQRRWRAQGNGEAEPGQLARRYKASLLRKDGSTIPVVASSRPLSDDDRDQVTLSTFAELNGLQQLAEDEWELPEPVLMGEQVASIIHELSNSLTIVFLQAQMLSKERRLARPVEQNLTVIRDQARLMMEMVSDLRATADPHQVRLEPTDINALVEQTLDLLAHQLQADDIAVVTDLEDGLPIAEADPYKLQQVLVNLINNARQAMASSAEAGQLNIVTQSIPGEDDGSATIQIRVMDNGPGIQPTVMPLIFEPFFTTKTGKGMGLGLSICEQIVERHGGQLLAENNAQGGASFVLVLPVAEEGSQDVTPRAEWTPSWLTESVPDPGTKPHVLIVDDEPAVAVSVGQILQAEGFVVTAATEAQQALDLLGELQIDVIVSDMKMPRMDGEQFWEAVRAQDPSLADRIIFATGDTSAQRAQAFLQKRGCPWIEKPFNPEELLCLVQDALHPVGSRSQE